jgi:hypothetical protein
MDLCPINASVGRRIDCKLLDYSDGGRCLVVQVAARTCARMLATQPSGCSSRSHTTFDVGLHPSMEDQGPSDGPAVKPRLGSGQKKGSAWPVASP